MTEKPLSARYTAWKVLNQCDLARHDVSDILNQYLPRTDRPAQATDIVYGTVRNMSVLDTVIEQCGSLEKSHVKPAQWNLLRIGAYELVYAPKTADYAILNEAVEIASHTGSKKMAGFVNAVLRNIHRKIEHREYTLEDTEHLRQIIPQNSETGCRFNFPLLPDPKNEHISYLSQAFSLPHYIIENWTAAYGPNQTKQICFACNRHPSVIIQPNTLYTNATALLEQLKAENIDCEMSPVETTVCIKSPGSISKIQAFNNGLFFIQDSTAAQAMKLLDPKPGWTILDLCAAPGGKAVTLAMLMNDTGTILASDINAKRLEQVRENAKRMKINAIEIIPPDNLDMEIQKYQKLDAIVLDVPCSNTGVLARRVEARYRLRKNTVSELLKTQNSLLSKAAELSKPNTYIVYSTCSIQNEENQQQIQQFLKQHTQFNLMKEQLTLPTLKTQRSFDHDGGYVAVLRQK